MSVPAWTNADLLSAFQQHLPTGRAWPRDAGAVQTQTIASLVPTFQRLTARAANLLVDAFPATTVELLPEWEETLGLPDPCAGESPTIDLRRAQVVARFTAGGGQSIAYYESLAATLGYDISIEQFSPFRVGVGRIGTPLYGLPWAFAWQVNAPTVTVEDFTIGESTIGDALVTVTGNTVLECEFQRLAPAHTKIIFSFS